MAPAAIEARVSAMQHERVRVAVVERFVGGRGDARTATHDVSRARWDAFYRPMYAQRCAMLGVRFTVLEHQRREFGA